MADVARCVATALKSADIHAVLTGGACASLYTRGGYKSSDLDFIIQNAVAPKQLDGAMATVGFKRTGNQLERPSGVESRRLHRPSPSSEPDLHSPVE